MGLTHWGRVTHICVSKLTIIGSYNGLSPSRRQAIIWTNAGILSIGPLGMNFSEILIEIDAFSFKKMHLKMSSAKWRPSCLGLNVLKSKPFSKYILKVLHWYTPVQVQILLALKKYRHIFNTFRSTHFEYFNFTEHILWHNILHVVPTGVSKNCFSKVIEGGVHLAFFQYRKKTS